MGADTQVGDEMAIIFFDGVCNLCNSSVNFIIDRDSQGVFKFAALQSESAAQKLKDFPVDLKQLDSIVLLHNSRIYTKSSAALRIAKTLGGIWSLFWVFWVVPKPIRDLAYDVIANNRYRWFGKRDVCRVPTPELKSRFLPES